MKSTYQDTFERIDDVKALLTLAQDLLQRLSARELDDAKASLRRAVQDLRDGEQKLIGNWDGEVDQK